MEDIRELLGAAIARAQAEADKQIVWYNRETGEVFDTIGDAMEDAAELYDFGDPTNAATWDDMPYIEIEWGQLKKVLGTFGRSAA